MPGWIAFLLVSAWLIHWIGWYIVAEDECWSVAGFMWIAFLTMPFAPITAPILLVKSIQIVRLNNYARDSYTGLFSVDPLDAFTEEELVRWNELQNSPEANGSREERKICSQKLHEIYSAALHRPEPAPEAEKPIALPDQERWDANQLVIQDGIAGLLRNNEAMQKSVRRLAWSSKYPNMSLADDADTPGWFTEWWNKGDLTTEPTLPENVIPIKPSEEALVARSQKEEALSVGNVSPVASIQTCEECGYDLGSRHPRRCPRCGTDFAQVRP